ncbi:unnamed protein product [Cercopithifilaria johnstoni]|uniref:Tudor domain-containing protein n=1 Tax=Cercopithifilaria johnstoni TaxID=2874296 RepID=A0A8J2Q9V7_9BILA|nr:unnamed protein product [Cercopithifilaria johnstoni]
MVAISLPTVIGNFEGEISHVVVAGNETLTFIKPFQWQEEKKRISLKLHSLAQSLKKFQSLSAVKSGEVYIANVKGSLERSYIIRRPTPDTYSIYLIDKGMQCEAQFDDIYELPPELLDFALFSCVCPVFVPFAEQLNIYKAFVGHKCKCEVETVSRSFVVLGYVRGRLLVENGDLYEDLQDIVSGRLANNNLDNFAKGSVRFEISERSTILWTTSGQMDDCSNSELTCRCSSTEKVTRRTRIVGRAPCRRSSIASKKIKYGQQYGSHMNTELCIEYDTIKVQALFTQTAFKQYKPDAIPATISVRFDKRDRALGRFWVVNKSIFSTIERILKESAERITGFPLLRQRLDDVPIREIPCIVRTRAESAYKAFYRAVASRFDARTKRFSIFLVDFGWFKWVLAKDVIDISAMDKSNPIRNLPVAMIHCQEDVTSVLHAKDLSKGANCYMRVNEYPIQDVYLVDLLETGRTMNDMLTGSMGETEGTSSSNKSSSETCELIASMMLGTLNNANHDVAAQTQHTWPICPPPFSMIVPVALPMMVSVPVPNADLLSTGHEQTSKLQNSQTKNIENTYIPQNNIKYSACYRNYIDQRFPGSNSQNIQREGYGSDLSIRNNVSFTSGDRAGNSFDGGNGGSKFAKGHHMLRKNFDSNSYRVRLTNWEKAVGADRAIRTKGSATGEQATSHVDDESNQLI